MNLHTSITSIDLMAFLFWKLDREAVILEGLEMLEQDAALKQSEREGWLEPESDWTIDTIAAKLAWDETIADGYRELATANETDLINLVLTIARNDYGNRFSYMAYLGSIDAALIAMYHYYIGYAILADNNKVDIIDTPWRVGQSMIARLRHCGALYPWEF